MYMMIELRRARGEKVFLCIKASEPIEETLPRDLVDRNSIGVILVKRTSNSDVRAGHQERVLVLWERSGHAKRTFA